MTKRDLKSVSTNADTDLSTPQNRTEHFLANIARLINTLPEGEYSRLERYLKYIAENGGGGGDVTVVPLVVSENGEYSETGKAFSPVVVQVPSSGSVPTGQIITMMATAAPDGYLVCDGTVYNISDYAALAAHIETNFGTPNHFGGDGVTTFAVPDLRGEFLRGTGTNGHSGQGSGATVGMHQNGTLQIGMYVRVNGEAYCGIAGNQANNVIGGGNVATNYVDSYVYNTIGKLVNFSGTSVQDMSTSDPMLPFTSRPTNTSVLYCIKT